MNHPVYCQIVGTLEGPSTIFTDIIPLVCMMLCMPQKLFLEPEESPTGGVGTYIFFFQQMLVFNVVLQIARVSKNSSTSFHLTTDILDWRLFSNARMSEKVSNRSGILYIV